jgi:hypothetical protein
VAASQADSCYLGISQGHGPIGCLGGHQDAGGLLSGTQVVDGDGLGEVVHQGGPSPFQAPSSASLRHPSQTAFDLLDRHHTDGQIRRVDVLGQVSTG